MRPPPRSGSPATWRASASCPSSPRWSRAQIRAALPAAPPERAEPFADVLRDLDEILAPGDHALEPPALLRVLRHLRERAGDPGRVPDGGAERQRDALAHLAGGDRAGGARASTGCASSLGLPEGLHGHIEDTASTSTLAALAAARHLRPGGAVRLLGARALLRGQGGAAPRAPAREDPRRRRVPPAAGRACGGAGRAGGGRGRGHGRDDVDDVGRPGRRDRAALRRGRRLAPRRRRLRRARPWSARRTAGPSRASSARTRSSSTRTSGSSRRSTAPSSTRAGRTSCGTPSASSRSTCARARRTSPT